MNKKAKKMISLVAAFAMAVTTLGLSVPAFSTASATTQKITGVNPGKAQVQIDWNTRYHYADLEKQLRELEATFPQFCELTSIGKTFEDRDLWCAAITNEKESAKYKREITVFGNIHGGEGESAASAMYSAWYLLENSANPEIADLLNHYIVYVIPLINPDGYEQSFIYRTRENMHPVDHDGDGIPFNDSYADINGDGMVGSIQALNMDTGRTSGSMGNESKDGNHDGILANDVKNSGVDLNRNFDFLWGQDGRMDTEGPSAASEPETQAVQAFVDSHSDMAGLITLHTGIQTTLYPWGYRAIDQDNPEEVADINFMKETATEMSKAMARATKRNFYAKQSFYDYQTYSELIDYAYGLYGIHSYTIEVYSPGSYNRGSISSAYVKNRDPYDPEGPNSMVPYVCMWNDTLPATKTVDYTHDQAVAIFEANGIDPGIVKVVDRTSATGYRAWADNEGIRISYNSERQTRGVAPQDQDELVTGVMEGILTMIDSEPPIEPDPTEEAIAKAKTKTVKGLTVKCSKQKFTVKWKKTSGVTGYQVVYRQKGASKYKVLKSTTSLKAVTKKLKKGKSYQFKVRPYTTINGQKVYGKYSAVKTVKCKK